MNLDKKQQLAMRMQVTKQTPYEGMTSQTVQFAFDFLLIERENDQDFCCHGWTSRSYNHNNDYGQLRLLQSHETGDDSQAGTLYYVDIHRAQCHQMERMCKVIQGIERKLDKLQDKLGYAVDLADYASRVASVMKVEILLLLNSEQARAQTGYRWNSMAMDGRAIDKMRRIITAELTPLEVASTELATV
jgi:hypothetical protein